MCDIWVIHITPVCLGSPSPPSIHSLSVGFQLSLSVSYTDTHMQTETHSWTRGVGLRGGGGVLLWKKIKCGIVTARYDKNRYIDLMKFGVRQRMERREWGGILGRWMMLGMGNRRRRYGGA